MSTYSLRISELTTLLSEAEEAKCPQEVQVRLRWFLHFARHRCVSSTCKEFGIARTTFYRWFNRFDPMDLESLQDNPKTPLAYERSSYSAAVPPACTGISVTKAKPIAKIEATENTLSIPKKILWFSIVSALGIGITIGGILSQPKSTPMEASVLPAAPGTEMNLQLSECTTIPSTDGTLLNCNVLLTNE